jgi:serine/threonine protein phosphatase 1
MNRMRSEIFAELDRPTRVWAVAAVHGEAARLRAVHDHIAGNSTPGDRLVYLGNFLGRGPDVFGTIEELLDFRAQFLARPGVEPWDIAHLRGAQEEMWTKLLQLQFAPNPLEVLDWMLGEGLGGTLAAYGVDVDDARHRCTEGTVALTRWTNDLRDVMRSHDGHDQLLASLRRYAITDNDQVIFVSTGLDPERRLGEQGDIFWWGGSRFEHIEGPIGTVQRAIRGYDRLQKGIVETEWRISLDAGCGFGGPLAAACFNPDGTLLELIKA